MTGRRSFPMWVYYLEASTRVLTFLVLVVGVAVLAWRVVRGDSLDSALLLGLAAAGLVLFGVSRLLFSMITPHSERGYLRISGVGRDFDNYSANELGVRITTKPYVFRGQRSGELELVVVDEAGKEYVEWCSVDTSHAMGLYDFTVSGASVRGAKTVTVSLWSDRNRGKLRARTGPITYS